MRVVTDLAGNVISTNAPVKAKAKKSRKRVPIANELVSGTNAWGKTLKASKINRHHTALNTQVKTATRSGGKRVNVMSTPTLEQYRAMNNK